MKDNLEYTKMAEYYDLFYQNKDYEREVSFIEKIIIKPKSTILDAGCGTGNHAKLLNSKGFIVYGFDLNKQMVDVANKKLPEHFETGNVLSYKTDKKFDAVISFFAVFNHLKDYREFVKAISNLKNLLKENGKMIIDLHNPQKSGEKRERYNSFERCMKWKICKLFNKEYSKITYTIEGKIFKTKHIFKIFDLNKIKKCLKRLNYKNCAFYENYNLNKIATKRSKNIQIVIEF